MSRILNVYLHSDFIGQLKQDDNGELRFKYDDNWLLSPVAKPLSISMPLKKDEFDRHICKAYFGGLLPEDKNRERLAKNLGISPRNDFAMLNEIGGECAGAVTFLPIEQTLVNTPPKYKPICDKELRIILEELPKRPLMAGEEGMRLSLAGAQDKICIYIDEKGEFSIPLDGAPSTHILKTAIKDLNNTIENEAFVMKLAQSCDLPVADVDILTIDNLKILAIKRYDRMIDNKGNIIRLHQEDFCQSMVISADHKYQHEGGPTIAHSFDLVRKVSTNPAIDIKNLLDIVIFNFLVGNNDAHGKNFSFLHQHDDTQLAPFYDLLSTAFYPTLSKRFAMHIGGQSNIIDVYPRHFEKMATETKLAKAATIKRVPFVATKILENLADIQKNIENTNEIAAFIENNTTNILKKFS